MSKLRQDRNYQPPRRRQVQQTIVVTNNNNKSIINSNNLKNEFRSSRNNAKSMEDDYCEDFEEEDEDEDEDEDEEEDEDTDQVVAKQKEAWLYDQAIRGRARQKAAEALNSQQKSCIGYQEKESSKDSAYGYSGGENSRLHTREPTPDTTNFQHLQQPRIINGGRGPHHRGPPPPVSQNPSRRKQFLSSLGTTPSNRRYTPRALPGMTKKPISHIVELADTAKVDFLNIVTREILSRGVFTDKAIKRALESSLNNVQNNVTMTEKSSLLAKLKQDLGLERPTSSKPLMSKFAANPRRSTSESSSSSNIVPKIAIVDNDHQHHRDVRDQLDEELASLLRDDSDQEVVDIVKSVLVGGSNKSNSRTSTGPRGGPVYSRYAN
jgi:hypothetical protein